MQGFLDLLGLPYQGAGILGSALAMDKNLAKVLYRTVNIPVADWRILDRTSGIQLAEIVSEFGLPVVIKPVRDGSSLGLTIARTEAQVASGIEQALKNDHRPRFPALTLCTTRKLSTRWNC